MQSVFMKTKALVLLNTTFLAVNILIFIILGNRNTTSDDDLTKDTKDLYIKKENFKNQLDQKIIYGNRLQDESIEISFDRTITKYKPEYRVPGIEYTPLVNCRAMLDGDESELRKAEDVMTTRPKVPISEEVFLEWTKDCKYYKYRRGFVTVPLSKEEAEFPLAFSIAMYTDIEQVERLLRAIYQPQNIYCIHIDLKSSVSLHRTMHHLANCFPNVFIASNQDKIKWGDVSVLLPAINCMRDLIEYHYGKWKYFINLTGQEMPLRTNYELVRIAKIFNGSNDIAGSIPRMDMERVLYKWDHRWSKTYQQTIFYNTYQPKSPPPYNLTFYKGELHGLFSWRMVEYIVKSKVAHDYLQWCWDSGHPSEHYWNVLNYNRHLKAPGAYIGPQALADEYGPEPIIRAKNWNGHYNNRQCQGKVIRGICVYGIRDLPWLDKRPELVANKFHLTFHYLAYDCLEEKHRNRTKLKTNVDFDKNLYMNLPTVKYGRKNGILS